MAPHTDDEPEHLPFFRSPLRDPEDLRPSVSEEDGFRSESTISFALPMDTERLLKESKKWKRKGSPRFRHLHQATNLELFYDLFFVANLTAFTYVHEVNDEVSLTQYIGFFSILWFTWYHVSLYDVRFAMDSVFERVCKAAQFLVMIGFALCGPEFNVGEQAGDADNEDPSFVFFRGMTIMLCISRVILVAQYVQMIWFARQYRNSIGVPLVIVACGYSVAAIIYGCLYFTFDLHHAQGYNYSFIAWYVVAVFETLLATAVSLNWRNLSYKRTHLVERMGLLTLIILGEGAIAIAKACQYLTKSGPIISLAGSVPAEIFCAVLILYFLYMLYFDWQHEASFGSVRQQAWSVLHFPLHVALVLAVEVISQCITWNASVRTAAELVHRVEYWNTQFASNSSSTFLECATELNATAHELLSTQLEVSTSFLSTSQGVAYLFQTDNAVIPTITNGTSDITAAQNALWWLGGVLFQTIFKIEGFYPPESQEQFEQVQYYTSAPVDFSRAYTDYYADAQEVIDRTFAIFELTYVYFFVAIGAFVMGCAILTALNRPSKRKDYVARLLVTGLAGLGLTLLATMVTTRHARIFITSPWPLPMVTLVLFGLVVMMNVGKRPPKLDEVGGRSNEVTPCASAAASVIHLRVPS